jgi:hypothetical protein
MTKMVLATLAVLSLLPGITAAQSLRGVIVDQETGDPIANARVLIFRPDSDGVMYGVRADDRGSFDLAAAVRDGGFQAGEHIVINIMARGYQLYEERIALPRHTAEDEYRLRPTSGADERTAAPRQIWIKVWLIEASGENGGKAEYPKEIESVVENLKPLFRFNRYRIIGRADVMGMEGSTLVFQSDPNRSSGGRFEAAATIGFGNGFIKLPELSVHVQEPLHKSINTSLNIPDGEMVILGASSGAATEGSLISVISARFITSSSPTDDRDHP